MIKNVFQSSGFGPAAIQSECPLGKPAHDQYFSKSEFENSGSPPNLESDESHGARSLPRKLSKTSKKLSTVMGAYSLDQFRQNSEYNDQPEISRQIESLSPGKY